jgi:hypothetical protein
MRPDNLRKKTLTVVAISVCLGGIKIGLTVGLRRALVPVQRKV